MNIDSTNFDKLEQHKGRTNSGQRVRANVSSALLVQLFAERGTPAFGLDRVDPCYWFVLERRIRARLTCEQDTGSSRTQMKALARTSGSHPRSSSSL
jgi:hypothetical protein